MRDEFGFDVGTSPHGLSADLPQSVRKHATGSGRAPSAKPVLLDASADRPGARFVRYVPVAFAALDWKVSARRIRALLAAKRLEGRREANGYWEVAYPYRFTFGQRGPALKRSRKPEAKREPL